MTGLAYFVSDGCYFIPEEWNDGAYNGGNWPPTAVLLTEEETLTYWRVQAPMGFKIGATAEGKPCWVEDIPPERPLVDVANDKRSEMRDACSNEITRSSYQSDALGAIYNYDCRLVDQVNLKVRYDIALATSASEPLWASDGTRYEWTPHTATEIMEVMIDMNEHIKTAQVKLASKLAAVDAATTNAQVNVITW
jgi:hypothetical protein